MPSTTLHLQKAVSPALLASARGADNGVARAKPPTHRATVKRVDQRPPTRSRSSTVHSSEPGRFKRTNDTADAASVDSRTPKQADAAQLQPLRPGSPAEFGAMDVSPTDTAAAAATVPVSVPVPQAETDDDRQLSKTLRALFPVPAGLDAAASLHWEQALSDMVRTRVPELREAGITASMAVTVARIIANHGHRSGVPATLTGLASGQGMLSAARAAQFFAAPVGVIAGVAAVAGALGAGAAQTAWDRAVEDIYLARLSAHPEHPSARLLLEIKRRDDSAGFAAAAASGFRGDARQYVNLDGLGFQSSVLALANHLVPVLGPQDEPSIESLACNREAQRFIATAPATAFNTTLQAKSYEPARFDVDGTPLAISRAHVGSRFRDRKFLGTLVRPAALGQMMSAPAGLALQYATSATKSVRALVNDIMLQVFDPNTSAVGSRTTTSGTVARTPAST